MIYETAQDWRAAAGKRVLLFGMSGLGKTHIANLLRAAGGWFHYSVDYRIGSRYLNEPIADSLKLEAMKNPYLRGLLMSDSITVQANLGFANLAPVSAWLGKPGNTALGGLAFADYTRRQALFRAAEVAALFDTGQFIARAERLYGYRNFICDTGGSICEWVDPENPADPVLTELAAQTLMVWIEGSAAHTAELVRRFDRAPKPMSYMPAFLDDAWATYRAETGQSEQEVDPDAFVRWTYARALAHRQPRYAAMARNWGVTVQADDVAKIKTPDDFDALIARALEAR